MHYPDEEAIANARRGCAAARAIEELNGRDIPGPVARQPRPGLVRVNSVPVLGTGDPTTPAERIRRRGSQACMAPSHPTGSLATGPEGVPPEENHKMQPSEPEPAQSEGSMCVSGGVDQRQNGADERPKPAIQQAEPPMQATSLEGKAAAAKTKARKLDDVPGGTQMSRYPDAHRQQVVAAPPKAEPDHDQDRRQAQNANLHRANTAVQKTPGRDDAPASPEQGDGADIEDLLDKEMKKEDDMTSGNNGPVSDACMSPEKTSGSTQHAATEPEKHAETSGPKKRPPKTEAQKAAHARYMRFSRSFQRTSTPDIYSIVLMLVV